MHLINKVQYELSNYQLAFIVGPVVVSPIKGMVSIAQAVHGAAGELFFGILSATADLLCMEKLSRDFDVIAHSFARVRCNGTNHLLSAIYNIFTFGVDGHRFEEFLGLRYRRLRVL